MTSAACYPDKSPKVNQLLHMLGDEIRRELVHYFENVIEGPSATIDDLVEHIAGRVPYVDEPQLRTTLWHQHLPILRERGWIEFDRREGRVRYHGNDDARQLLRDPIEVFDRVRVLLLVEAKRLVDGADLVIADFYLGSVVDSLGRDLVVGG